MPKDSTPLVTDSTESIVPTDNDNQEYLIIDGEKTSFKEGGFGSKLKADLRATVAGNLSADTFRDGLNRLISEGLDYDTTSFTKEFIALVEKYQADSLTFTVSIEAESRVMSPVNIVILSAIDTICQNWLTYTTPARGGKGPKKTEQTVVKIGKKKA
jgi:hypothetical protein